MKCVSSLAVLLLLVLSVSAISYLITPHELIFKEEVLPTNPQELFNSLYNGTLNILPTSFLKTLKGVMSFSKQHITSSLQCLWNYRCSDIFNILLGIRITLVVVNWTLKSIETFLAFFTNARKDRIRCPRNRNHRALLNLRHRYENKPSVSPSYCTCGRRNCCR